MRTQQGLVGVGAAQRMDTFGTSTSVSFIAQLDSTPRELRHEFGSPKQLAAALNDTGSRIENPVTVWDTRYTLACIPDG